MMESHIATTEPLIDPAASQFMIQLSEAIRAYTRDKVADDLYALHYRGADMQGVIERWLYFALVNDDMLYRHFSGGKSDVQNLTLAGQWIAPYLLEGKAARKPGFRALAAATTTGWKNLLQQEALHGSLQMSAAYANDASGKSILFHVGASKFLRYLAPVAERFADRSAFLTLREPGLAKEIAATGAPVVSIEPPTSLETRGYVTPALEDWASLCRDYDAIVSALTQIGCSRLVLAEGNSPSHELLARAARRLGIRNICIQQGWSPIVHSGFRDMRYDAMCVWGPDIAKLLAPSNPRQSFFITGSHVLADTPHIEKKSVKGDAVGFFLQKGSRLITDAAWDAMLDLVRWTAERFPDRQVLVREHPGAPLTVDETNRFARLPNIELVPAAVVGLADVLAQCRIAVSIFSTTLLEAAASNVVPLIVNMTGMKKFSPDLERMGAGMEVTGPKQARDALERLMGPHGDTIRDNLAAIRPRFFARTGSDAREAIARVIEARTNGDCRDLAYMPERH